MPIVFSFMAAGAPWNARKRWSGGRYWGTGETLPLSLGNVSKSNIDLLLSVAIFCAAKTMAEIALTGWVFLFRANMVQTGCQVLVDCR